MVKCFSDKFNAETERRGDAKKKINTPYIIQNDRLKKFSLDFSSLSPRLCVGFVKEQQI